MSAVAVVTIVVVVAAAVREDLGVAGLGVRLEGVGRGAEVRQRSGVGQLDEVGGGVRARERDLVERALPGTHAVAVAVFVVGAAGENQRAGDGEGSECCEGGFTPARCHSGNSLS